MTGDAATTEDGAAALAVARAFFTDLDEKWIGAHARRELVVEVANNRPDAVRVDRALLLSGGVWKPAAFSHRDDIAPGAVDKVVVSSGAELDVSQPGVPVAIRLRADGRRVPF